MVVLETCLANESQSRSSYIGKETLRTCFSSCLLKAPSMECGDGKEEHEREKGKLHCLRALSAPMYHANNVSICQQLELLPGKWYTFGRSKSTCDIIFQDVRVSRQHCQVYVDPESRKLYLIDGAPSQIPLRSGSQKELNNYTPLSSTPVLETTSMSEVVKREATQNARTPSLFAQSEDQHPESRLLKRAKSSLNGIFINGRRLAYGSYEFLYPGDEVSLAASTKGTNALDPSFGAAVGFLVESVPPREYVPNLSTHKSLPASPAVVNTQKVLQSSATSSEGDEQNRSLFFSSQVIRETQEEPPFFRDECNLNTSISVEERDPAAVASTRESLKKVSSQIAFNNRELPVVDDDVCLSQGHPNRNIQFESASHAGSRHENVWVRWSGKKRHHIETAVGIESSGTYRGCPAGGDVRNKSMATTEVAKGNPPKRDTKFSLERQFLSTRTDIHTSGAMQDRDVQDRDLKFSDYSNTRNGVVVADQFESPQPELDTTSNHQSLQGATSDIEDCTYLSCGKEERALRWLHDNENLRPVSTVKIDSSPRHYRARDRVRSSEEILKLMSRRAGKNDPKKLQSNSMKDMTLPIKVGSKASEVMTSSMPDVCQKADLVQAASFKTGQNMNYGAGAGLLAASENWKEQRVGDDHLEENSNLSVDSGVQSGDDAILQTPEDVACELQAKATFEQEDRAVKNKMHASLGDTDYSSKLEDDNNLQRMRLLSGNGPGNQGFCLNRLKGKHPDMEGRTGGVSLQELLAPLDEVVEIFAATFTSDILWFLTSNNLSPELPVTVACHDYERSWSISPEDRIASPYPEWPKLTVVYPPFPDILAFSSKSKEGFRRGIGCHHPKLFLVRFYNRLRVVISSANLNRRQWLRTTNTVWWKDFPQLETPNYKALFQCSEPNSKVSLQTTGDFSAQLAYFIACLLVDVPAKAHWVVNMAQYDFSAAEASLVVSIPGLHGCPYPALPQTSLVKLNEDSKASEETGDITSLKYLGVVGTTVVGISYRFCAAADPKGLRVRSLARLLNDVGTDEEGMVVVLLKRAKNIPADPNAVSVIMGPGAKGLVNHALLQDMSRDSSSPLSSPDSCVQVGFLPRKTAIWVAPLWDGGLCTFMARIWPQEALSIASGVSEVFVRLSLYVFEGPRFGCLCGVPPTAEQEIALCGLLSVLQYPLGLHRLQQVLNGCNWPNSAETDFVFGSSSVGTSLDAPFLAAFSAAAGRRAVASSASEDSDPQWGCWTADHEAEDPSIGVVFPTIERAKSSNEGPLSHFGVLCFAEKTWERLKPAKLLHDAVPHPATRDGIPMHSKVAVRRFQHHAKGLSFGWVYCGSHNFSPAAWGRPLAKTPMSAVPVFGTPLQISNYELGLIFMEPPPSNSDSFDSKDSLSTAGAYDALKLNPKSSSKYCGKLQDEEEPILDAEELKGIDRFELPFVMPPPKYRATDQPATGKALYRILLDLQSECKSVEEAGELAERALGDGEESGESEPDEEAEMATATLQEGLIGETAPSKIEQQYAEALWSQCEPF